MSEDQNHHILQKLESIERRLRALEEKGYGVGKADGKVHTPALQSETYLEPEVPAQSPETKKVQSGFEGTPSVMEGIEPTDWEKVLGGNWMVRIGIAALVLGAGFFFKFAVDNNWVGELGRVVLGIVVGLGLIGAGEVWKKKYSTYAQILAGGGIVMLYVSLYAAYAFYELIAPLPAFFALGVVTVAAGALALRYNQPTIAVIGILGGFFTPFMFIRTLAEGTLIIYTLLLDIGILALCSMRNWRALTLVGLIGSILLYNYWRAQFYTAENLLLAEGFLTAVFLIFFFSTILWHFLWNKKPDGTDFSLMIANAVIYFGFSFQLLNERFDSFMSIFALLLAALYGVFAYGALQRARDASSQLSLFLGGISLFFLTIAIPLELTSHWLVIAWSMEGVILVLLGFLIKSVYMRYGGFIVLALAGLRLFLFGLELSQEAIFIPFLNERFFTYIVFVSALFAAAYLYKRFHVRVLKQESLAVPTLLLFGNAVLLGIISSDVIRYFDIAARAERLEGLNANQDLIRSLQHAENFSLSILWAVYSIILVAWGIVGRIRALRIAGLLLFWITILKVFIIDVFSIGGIFRIGSLISLGVILLITGYLYQRYNDRIKEFFGGEIDQEQSHISK